MNTKVKYGLVLLFSLVVFGGGGINAHVSADTSEAAAKSTQVQSVSDVKSTVKANSTSSISSNTVSDMSANKHSTSIDDNTKTTKDSDSSVTTTYGDAKDNQVTANDSSTSKVDNGNEVTVNDNTDAKDESSTTSNTSSDTPVGAQEAPQGEAADSSSVSSTSDSASSSSTSSKSSASTHDDTSSTDLTAGASVVGANDDTLNKVVKGIVDKVTSDTDKTTTEDQSTTSSVKTDTSHDDVVVLESPDAANADEMQETLIVPNQPVIESRNVQNDIVGNTFADKVTKSNPVAAKATVSAASNKTKLLPFNAFSNRIYRHVLNTTPKPGTVTTTSGKKVTLTTPVKHVKYIEHDSTGVSETLPLMGALVVIAVVGVGFIAFDPLKFLFK